MRWAIMPQPILTPTVRTRQSAPQHIETIIYHDAGNFRAMIEHQKSCGAIKMSEAKIDPTSRVHQSAITGKDCDIGPYCVVGPHVELHEGVILDPQCGYRLCA